MRKIEYEKKIAVLLLLQLLVACKGQDAGTTKATYVQKFEDGLKGPVKEITKYTCKVENDIIPVDKSNFYEKTTKQFDSLGNVLKISYQWDFGESKSISSGVYSGKGREISFVETTNFNERKQWRQATRTSGLIITIIILLQQTKAPIQILSRWIMITE